MEYRVRREFKDGVLVRLSLGVPETDSYLEFVRYRCRPNTWISYAYDLQAFLNAVKKPVTQVTSSDIFAFIRSQQEGTTQDGDGRRPRRQGTGLAPQTVKRRLATVSSLYEYLVVRGDTPIRANPVPRGMPVRGRVWGGWSNGVTPLVKAPHHLPMPLDRQVVSQFLDSLRTHRDRAMVLLMLLGGLRKSEVLGLALEDLDFGQRTLMVREAKGGRSRVIPVAASAFETMLRYLNEERPRSASTRVFLAMKGPRRGQPLSVPALDTIIVYHRRRAGTPEVQCHRLRHTCLTRLRQSGMSLEAIQAQAGHRSILTTRIYLHLCPKELQEEYMRLADSLFTPQGEEAASNE